MKKIALLIAFLLLSTLAVSLVLADGFRVSPAWIKIYRLTRGQEVETTVRITNLNTEEQTFTIEKTGEVADWIDFYKPDNMEDPIEQITIDADTVQEIKTKINIPEDAANRYYSSIMYVKSTLTDAPEANTSAVSLRYPINVLLQVIGDQFLDGEVTNFVGKDTEVNRPARIYFDFENTGTVAAIPRVVITIMSGGTEIDSFEHEKTEVDIYEKETIAVEWDTSGQGLGEYQANVKVYLGEDNIAERVVSFHILERGTLSIEGSILNVEAPETMSTGEIAKIEVEFENTGEIDMIAKIKGEVKDDKDNLVSVLEGDETLIKTGETGTLVAYFKPEKTGTFIIDADVVFEGKKMNMNTIQIDVSRGSTPSGDISFSLNDMFIIVIIIFAALIGFAIIKLKNF